MRKWALEIVLATLILLLACQRFYHRPADAADALTVPDGVEYAVTAQRFATLGQFNIRVGEQNFPSRYPPTLSLLLTPTYIVSRDELGAGIFAIFALALLGTAAAALAGAMIAQNTSSNARSARLLASSCAVLALAFEPMIGFHAGRIQSDAPVVFLALTQWAALLVWSRWPERLWLLLAAGTATALAFGMRPLALVLLLPLTVALASQAGAFRRPTALAAAFAPAVAMIAANALYQRMVFGSFFRTGYQFWCPLPYDFPELVFSTVYVPANMKVAGALLVISAAAGISGLVVLWWQARRGLPVTLAVWAASALISIVQLFYFYTDPRLHLMFVTVSWVLAGVGVGVAIGGLGWVASRWWLPVAAVLCGVLLSPRFPPFALPQPFRALALALDRQAPRDALIVTGLDPVLVEALVLRNTTRTWLPATRRQEYADKAIAPHRISPRPAGLTWPASHRDPRLLAAGAVDAVPRVAIEDLGFITAALASGRTVVIDASIPPDARRILADTFEISPMTSDGLTHRLQLRPAPTIQPP